MNNDISILVGIDRDNTINLDPEGYFGKDDDWQDKVELVAGAAEGLKLLSDAPHVATAVISQQVGVAKGMYDERRVQEVNAYIHGMLVGHGIKIDSWQYCPYVDHAGAERWRDRGVTTVRDEYVVGDDRLRLLKPNIGMLINAAEEIGLGDVEIYVIGDRLSDVMTGINAGGIGILVNNPDISRGNSKHDNAAEFDRMANEYPGRVHMVMNLVDAARMIRGVK